MLKEEFEDIKGVIRIRKSKDRQHNGQKGKSSGGQTNMYHHWQQLCFDNTPYELLFCSSISGYSVEAF